MFYLAVNYFIILLGCYISYYFWVVMYFVAWRYKIWFYTSMLLLIFIIWFFYYYYYCWCCCRRRLCHPSSIVIHYPSILLPSFSLPSSSILSSFILQSFIPVFLHSPPSFILPSFFYSSFLHPSIHPSFLHSSFLHLHLRTKGRQVGHRESSSVSSCTPNNRRGIFNFGCILIHYTWYGRCMNWQDTYMYINCL